MYLRIFALYFWGAYTSLDTHMEEKCGSERMNRAADIVYLSWMESNQITKKEN